MRYAQIDKETNLMKSAPSKLPNIWTTPEGATVTHFNKLSKKSLQALDWLPVVYEELTEGATHSLTPSYDEANQQFVYEAIPQDIGILLKESKRRIDEIASFTCTRYISQGVGQDCRYMMKREQAINFLTDQNPDMNNYPMIKCEAEGCGVTHVEIAEFIVQTSETWVNLAAKVEAARVGGKKKCSESKDVAEMIKYRDEAIAILESI